MDCRSSSMKWPTSRGLPAVIALQSSTATAVEYCNLGGWRRGSLLHQRPSRPVQRRRLGRLMVVAGERGLAVRLPGDRAGGQNAQDDQSFAHGPSPPGLALETLG